MRAATLGLRATGLVLLLAAAAAAEDAKLPRPLAIGETLPAFQAKDLEGRPFDLSKARSVTPEEALAAVAAAARTRGAGEVTRETALDALPGLRKGSTVDADLRAAFLADAGRPFGRVADPAKAAAWTTVGDVATWIEGAAKAPIVFVAWSSGCPTCRMYDERLAGIAASTGARVYLLASNWNDTDEQIRAAVTERKVPFPVLIDREQAVTDVLGGRKTPHAFALDASNALRYVGAIDSDPALQEDAAKRATWLKDALAALAEGRSFDVLATAPKG